MSRNVMLLALVALPAGLAGQTPPLRAVDLNSTEIGAFLDALPRDRISDLPIRVADAGTHHVGVYGVFRPRSLPGGAIRHETSVSEIYYILEGRGTLVTDGAIAEERSTGNSPNTGRPNFSGSAIQGGVSRRVGPGDIIIIPPNVAHWWSELESDIRYLIFRPDPERLQPLR